MAHNDINEAKSTYESFISMTKVSMVIIALVTALVVVIIQ
jgi:Bacterial aa3 type cytochrome c oxidase subunit IV